MPQIILKERTAHLASYTFFTRDADQYKNASFSQLYQPPRTFISQNTYHQLLSSCENTSRSSRLQMFFKIGVVKSFANFTGKHLCWSLFLKNLQGESLQFHKERLQHRCFSSKKQSRCLVVNQAGHDLYFDYLLIHQRHIKNLIKYLRWSFLRKQLAA